MKKIVFPTDFSEDSVKAFEFAVNYLSNKETEFIITNVYQMPSGNVSGTFYLLEEIKRQAEADMKNFVSDLSNKYPSINLTSKVLQGDFDSQCNAVAIQYQADCIIMGTKGASGIKEALIGSNTASLMKGLKAPLFVVPFDAMNNKLEKFIFSYDGTELSNTAKDQISKFSSWFKLNTIAVHVNNQKNKALSSWSELDHLFGKNKFETQEITAEQFEEGLESVCKNLNGILCMVRHKKSFWENLFNQSDSRRAVMHAELPVLVIPE